MSLKCLLGKYHWRGFHPQGINRNKPTLQDLQVRERNQLRKAFSSTHDCFAPETSCTAESSPLPGKYPSTLKIYLLASLVLISAKNYRSFGHTIVK